MASLPFSVPTFDTIHASSLIPSLILLLRLGGGLVSRPGGCCRCGAAVFRPVGERAGMGCGLVPMLRGHFFNAVRPFLMRYRQYRHCSISVGGWDPTNQRGATGINAAC